MGWDGMDEWDGWNGWRQIGREGGVSKMREGWDGVGMVLGWKRIA